MRTARMQAYRQVVAIFLAFSALGLGSRLLVVVATPDRGSSGMCTFVTDFWEGDRILC